MTFTSGTPQISECTAYSDLVSVRAPLTRAHTASESVKIWVERETSELASIADAAMPTMPLLRASSIGSVFDGVGSDAEREHHHEHVGHDEQEEPEGDRTGEDPAAGAEVVLDAAKGDVDHGHVRTTPFEVVHHALGTRLDRVDRALERDGFAGAASLS